MKSSTKSNTNTTTGIMTHTNSSSSSKRDRIFSELIQVVPLGEKALTQHQNQLFGHHSSIRQPKMSMPPDDETFEIMAEELTCPSEVNDPANDDVIKRSYRIMTYIVQDIQEAQDFLSNKFGNQEKYSDILYIKNLINPTRAGLLAKQIFCAYRQLVVTMNSSHLKQGTASNGDLQSSHSTPLVVPRPHLPHLNQTLQALLQAFPAQVIGASSRGGEKGLEQSLEPMMELHSRLVTRSTNDIDGILGTPQYSSPLDLVKNIIILGCTGKRKNYSSLSFQQQQAQQMQMQQSFSAQSNKTLVNIGHRRKFVHGLLKWGGFEKLISMILQDGACGQDALEALLEIIDYILYPDDMSLNGNMDQSSSNDKSGTNTKTNNSGKQRESVGEEELLAQLASPKVIHGLFECLLLDDSVSSFADEAEHKNGVEGVYPQQNMKSISSALLGLFELATGKKKVQTEPPVPTSMLSKAEDDAVECKMANEEMKLPPGIEENPMIQAGITDKMHAALCQDMKSLVKAMDVYMVAGGTHTVGGEGKCDVADKNEDLDVTTAPVKHPGGYVIEKPFTSNRLQLLTLFTDLVTYKSHSTSTSLYKTEYQGAVQALDEIIEFPLPPDPFMSLQDASNTQKTYNPWPGICDLVFEYPENAMLHVQFYRLVHALCMTNHEPTLKLLVQKCKFLSRALKVCNVQDKPSSSRGILIRCLNALRLHSESMAPNSFLRHYMESHDGWKAVQNELKRMTIEQQQHGGGIAVPVGTENVCVTTLESDVDIGLGSQYAAELGFPPSIQPYIGTTNDKSSAVTASPTETGNVSDADASSGTKKKKKAKKKKCKK